MNATCAENPEDCRRNHNLIFDEGEDNILTQSVPSDSQIAKTSANGSCQLPCLEAGNEHSLVLRVYPDGIILFELRMGEEEGEDIQARDIDLIWRGEFIVNRVYARNVDKLKYRWNKLLPEELKFNCFSLDIVCPCVWSQGNRHEKISSKLQDPRCW